jgi:hypothetical protein
VQCDELVPDIAETAGNELARLFRYRKTCPGKSVDVNVVEPLLSGENVGVGESVFVDDFEL